MNWLIWRKNQFLKCWFPHLMIPSWRLPPLEKMCPKSAESSRETCYLNSIRIENLGVATVKDLGIRSKDIVGDCGKLENLLVGKNMDSKIKKNSKTYKVLYSVSSPVKAKPLKKVKAGWQVPRIGQILEQASP